MNRRKFIFGGSATAGLAGLGLGAAGFVESLKPRVVNLEVALARLPQSFQGFTVAQLSDLHYQEHFSAITIRKAIEIVNGLRPDLVVLTGDYVTVPFLERAKLLPRAVATIVPCAAVLQGLVGPKLAVLGNHDATAGAAQITRTLEDSAIPVLRNRAVAIERGADRIWIAGIDDLLRGRPDLIATLQKIPAGECTILLAHEPDFADEVPKDKVDLQLSGHSHGGQIWFPGIGAPYLPPLARKYPRGLHQLGKLTLYTNMGIGTIRLPIRINCPPEITLITLQAGDGRAVSSPKA